MTNQNTTRIQLVCPVCRSTLGETGDGLVCTNANCRRLYTVESGIPCLLPDQSSELDQSAWAALQTVAKI